MFVCPVELQSELVGVMRACVFATRSKQEDMALNNQHDPKQSMMIHYSNVNC